MRCYGNSIMAAVTLDSGPSKQRGYKNFKGYFGEPCLSSDTVKLGHKIFFISNISKMRYYYNAYLI